MSKAGKARPPLPSKQQILDFIKDNPGKVGKREIARAFQVAGADRIRLKALLKDLALEGTVERGQGRRLTPAGVLPDVSVVDVFEIDVDGELIARPANWRGDGAPPKITMAPAGRGLPALGIGDRVLARLTATGPDRYDGRMIRRLEAAPNEIIGVYNVVGRDGRIQPADKRDRHELVVAHENAHGAMSGDVVVAELLPGRAFGLRHARVRQRIGRMGDPATFSLVAVHQHGIPTRFGDDALAEAVAAKPVRLAGRTDLRDIPLVTIDPDDARDHDDAVYAEADSDGANPGGWKVLVAIADVSWYVRPGSGLDRDARQRGNSVYFPDRVVPMLPEELSADLCSLVEDKPRACLAVEMWFDAEGNKLRHKFIRGLMRSAASLNYTQVQRARDGMPDAVTAALLPTVIEPLYGAYGALVRARDRRQPLGIDLPERRVRIGADGFIAAVEPRERFDSHRLIEEFMIAANVCAAETLEAVRQPCMYRVHDEPAADKLEALRDFLQTLNYRLARGQVLRPQVFNGILAKAIGTPQQHLVHEVVLRSQSQAIYSPDNLGHFGLNLRRYAHFTSPIRRYADLLVHRALVAGCKFGQGGLSEFDVANFTATAELISRSERRAMAAERDAMDRFTAAFMAAQVGATFAGRISGVTRFGLFVNLTESGADGLVPMSSLGDDYYTHDETRHALVGRRTRTVFQLGDRVEVRLAEADVVTGGLRLEILRDLGKERSGPPARKPQHRPQSGKPPNISRSRRRR